jgi:S1 RNA binding domain protein
MQVEVGKIVEGKVTGVTKFGVFVEMADSVTGMVHISEVSDTYVKELSDFVKVGDSVKVKIISVSPENKISLSMKKAKENAGGPVPKKTESFQKRAPRPREESTGPSSYVWTPPKRQEEMTFEEMMNKFKQSSEEKMSDLKRVMDVKKGSSRRGK